MITNVTDDSFEEEVLNSSTPVLVDFWAEWCNPCKMLSPILDDIATELKDKVKIVKLNIDSDRNTPTKFNVMSIPTLILYQNGKIIATKVGALNKNILSDWLKQSL